MVEQVWVLPPTRSHYRLYCWLARSVDGGERWPGREVRAVADQGVGASAGYLAGCPQCRHQLGVKPPLWVLLPGQEGELQSFPAYTPPQLGSKKLFNYPDQGWGGLTVQMAREIYFVHFATIPQPEKVSLVA